MMGCSMEAIFVRPVMCRSSKERLDRGVEVDACHNQEMI
jgi:hypothetical protein